jgi:hypothetical protein
MFYDSFTFTISALIVTPPRLPRLCPSSEFEILLIVNCFNPTDVAVGTESLPNSFPGDCLVEFCSREHPPSDRILPPRKLGTLFGTSLTLKSECDCLSIYPTETINLSAKIVCRVEHNAARDTCTFLLTEVALVELFVCSRHGITK